MCHKQVHICAVCVCMSVRVHMLYSNNMQNHSEGGKLEGREAIGFVNGQPLS